MTNALYDKGREGFGNKEIGWGVDNIRAILIDVSEYEVNLAEDETLEDIPGDARIAVSGNLSNKTYAGGVMGADSTTIESVPSALVSAIVLYQHTGTESTSRLIAYIDDGVNLPIQSNGGNIILDWEQEGDKIFKL